MTKKTKPKDMITIGLSINHHPESLQPCALCGVEFQAGPVLTSVLHDNKMIYVCTFCRGGENADDQLKTRAEKLEANTLYLRNLIGRLKFPGHEEWEMVSAQHQRDYVAQYEKDYGVAIDLSNLGSIKISNIDDELPF